MSLKKTIRNFTAGAAIGLAALVGGEAKAAPVQVTYMPNQVGTVAAPIVGLGSTSTDYLLTNQFGTSTLNLNFNGNGQQVPGFENPSTAKDAASHNDQYMFQLGTDNNVRRVNLTNGNIDVPFGIFSAGPGAFGIGYDSSLNQIGIGKIQNGQMTFQVYDLGTGAISNLATFSYDAATYGTPTGLDFVNHNGSQRMLVGTKDAYCPEQEELFNHVLDFNAKTGSLDQYLKILQNSGSLEDVLYVDGKLATSFQSGGSGNVRVGNYTPVPEPATLAILGLGALGASALGRRKYVPSNEPKEN